MEINVLIQFTESALELGRDFTALFCRQRLVPRKGWLRTMAAHDGVGWEAD